MANTLKFGTDGNWAVKKDSVLAYNDENSNFKPLPFDFTRDSTATYVDSDGLIKTASNNEARIDYLGNTNGHLLLEPAITNQLQYSEDFTQSEWSKSNVNTPVLQTSVIAPDGTTNVYLATNSATSNPLLYDNEIGSSTNDSTFSVFVKYYNTRYLSVRIDSPTKRVLFDIENGIVISVDSGVNGSIKNYGNGWFRCSITHTTLTAANNAVIEFNDSGLTSDFTLSATGLGYYIFGAQYEVNPYLTSYIKTSGSSVTRAADTANGAGNSEVFNDSEGVLFVDISALANDSTNRLICINDGSSSNRVLIKLDDSSNVLNATAGSGSVGVTLSDETIFNKIALKYKVNDIELWVNGFLVDTDTTATMPTGLSEIDFDKSDGTNDFYGKTKEIRYFNTALTDAELEYETSYRSLSEMVTELNLNTL